MSRVTPTWPDYTTIEVPPRYLDPMVAERALLATTRLPGDADSTPDVIVAVPYKAAQASDWNKGALHRQIEYCLRDGIRALRAAEVP